MEPTTRSVRFTRNAALAAAAALALLAPACSKDGGTSTTGTTSGASSSAPPASAGSSTSAPGGTGSTAAGTTSRPPGSSTVTTGSATSSSAGPTTTKTTPPDGDGDGQLSGATIADKTGGSTTAAGRSLLTDVRNGVHPGFHRVVFDFQDHVPGWSVKYVDKPVIADASGFEVPVAGNFVLQIRLEPSSGVDMEATATAGEVVTTYNGPDRITVNGTQVTELVESGDFEAVLHWNIGTKAKVPFTVSMLSNPSRLVIDVADS